MNKIKIILAILMVVLITGCADSVSFEQAIEMTPVGFWYGLWHGMTFVCSCIGSMFSDNIAVYAIYNSGGWYDFGFMLGVSGISAGVIVKV